MVVKHSQGANLQQLLRTLPMGFPLACRIRLDRLHLSSSIQYLTIVVVHHRQIVNTVRQQQPQHRNSPFAPCVGQRQHHFGAEMLTAKRYAMHVVSEPERVTPALMPKLKLLL